MASTWLSAPALVDLIGEEAAIRLCQEYGGLRIYITKRPESSKLVPTIGGVAAESLCAAFGGEEIMLPSLIRRPHIKEKIIVMLEAGASLSMVARECNCTQRYVHYVRRDIGLTPPRPARKPKKQKILEVLRANPENLSTREIAERFGVSRDYVYGLRSEFGIARLEATQKAHREAERNA